MIDHLAVEVRGLTKSYGDKAAVAGVDLEVERGEVFALLGPNGAGKTTTVEILEGHRRRDAGSVSVLGFDPATGGADYRRHIGIVLQSTGLERYLTVAELIEQFRGYYDDPLPLDEIIELVGLDEQRDQRVRRLSGGQQRRVDVAVGLAGNPDLLFLDEPTTGFDPGARRNAWGMVRGLQELGKTVLLTTHYMDEAQHLADRVAVLVDGRIVASGPPSELAGASATIIAFRPPKPALPKGLARHFVLDGEVLVGATEQPTALVHELTAWAVARDVELADLEIRRPTLEETYLSLVTEGTE